MAGQTFVIETNFGHGKGQIEVQGRRLWEQMIFPIYHAIRKPHLSLADIGGVDVGEHAHFIS